MLDRRQETQRAVLDAVVKIIGPEAEACHMHAHPPHPHGNEFGGRFTVTSVGAGQKCAFTISI